MKTKQEILIQRLHELLVEINEEVINDDEFNDWLNSNYFFEEDLEEVIVKIKKSKNNIFTILRVLFLKVKSSFFAWKGWDSFHCI